MLEILNDNKEICLSISILYLINEEFAYLYLFVLNYYINKSLNI